MNSKKHEGMDLSKDKMAMQRLKEAAEKAKKELSTVYRPQTSTCRFITVNVRMARSIWISTLTRAKFDELTA